MAIAGIDHIDIAVEDPSSLASFLVSLGFEEVRRIADRGIIEVRFPGGSDQPFFVIHPTVEPNGKTRKVGLDHLAVRMTDLNADYEALVAKGFAFSKGAPRLTGSGRTVTTLVNPQIKLQLVSPPA